MTNPVYIAARNCMTDDMTKAAKTPAVFEPPISVRPNKNSALARVAASARTGPRGSLSDLLHGWADRHEREAGEVVAAASPPPDVSAFD
jgi:hypothetical protein